MKHYNFGEQSMETHTKTKKSVQVYQHPKYKDSKKAAIKLIEEGKYGLAEHDFWILKNMLTGKVMYSGLIISHTGCLKINDRLPATDKFKPECVQIIKDEKDEKAMSYICKEQGIYEIGEVNKENCKIEYFYSMMLKRLMDRVILKSTKIAFDGIYSEPEIDQNTFESSNIDQAKPTSHTDDQVKKAALNSFVTLTFNEIDRKELIEQFTEMNDMAQRRNFYKQIKARIEKGKSA